jgi:hypothetical protein
VTSRQRRKIAGAVLHCCCASGSPGPPPSGSVGETHPTLCCPNNPFPTVLRATISGTVGMNGTYPITINRLNENGNAGSWTSKWIIQARGCTLGPPFLGPYALKFQIIFTTGCGLVIYQGLADDDEESWNGGFPTGDFETIAYPPGPSVCNPPHLKFFLCRTAQEGTPVIGCPDYTRFGGPLREPINERCGTRGPEDVGPRIEITL